MSMTREKSKFFLGLGLIVCLFVYSMLRQRQDLAGHDYAVVLLVTLAALAFDYRKVSQFLTVANETRGSHDLAIKTALTTTLRSPIFIKTLQTELLTLYYAFFAQSASGDNSNGTMQFSYEKSSNAHDIYLFFALSQLPFLPFIHIFVEYRVGPGPAWLISVLTLWSVVWFLAQVEAVRLRPIQMTDDHLNYRFGLAWAADIPVGKIKMARSVDIAEALDGNDMFLSPLGSTKNVILEFEEAIQFSGPYMQKRREKMAAISVDNPSRFLRQLALNGVAIGSTYHSAYDG